VRYNIIISQIQTTNQIGIALNRYIDIKAYTAYTIYFKFVVAKNHILNTQRNCINLVGILGLFHKN